jgi:hypothetical protein
VGHRRGGDDLDRLEHRVADVVQQPLPRTEHDRHDVQVQLVQEPGGQDWPTVLAPPAIETSWSPAAARAAARADSIPSVTKWNVVPPCITKGSRG